MSTLSREAAAAMVAGPDLNILIAEAIFGCQWQGVLMQKSVEQLTGYINGQRLIWAYRKMRAGKPVQNSPVELAGGSSPYLPDFSGDIAAAWLVVEMLRAQGAQLVLETTDGEHLPGWRARIDYLGDSLIGRGALADSPALAICRAALDAKIAAVPSLPIQVALAANS